MNTTTMTDDENDACEDASTLGLRPGIWPHRVTFKGRVYSMTRVAIVREGEIMAQRYEDEQGRRLLIIND